MKRIHARLPAEATFVLPLLLVVVVAFNLPLLLMLSRSVLEPEPTLAHFETLVTSPVYLQVLANTFKIAAITMVVTIVLGYPLAYWIRTLSPKWRIVAVAAVVIPFWISILVRTYAWIVILGNNGVVNRTLLDLGLVGSPVQLLYNELGVIIGTVNVLLPFLVLPLLASMLAIDDRLLQAAYSMGASRVAVFVRVFFPLTVAALSAGGVLVFILTLGFFVTPAILGGGRVSMIANMLDTLINEIPRWELAAAISVVLLVATLLAYALYRRLENAAATS